MIGIGEIRILNKDNVFRDKIWSKKGDEVRIISVNGSAIIYENKKGERYPCNIKDLK